jgi:hypothetical protein
MKRGTGPIQASKLCAIPLAVLCARQRILAWYDWCPDVARGGGAIVEAVEMVLASSIL